jgi:acetyl-CoA synthetase
VLDQRALDLERADQMARGLDQVVGPADEPEIAVRVAQREIVFRNTLPKTRSGKIMRRLLKARELGLAEGDISTLETDET